MNRSQKNKILDVSSCNRFPPWGSSAWTPAEVLSGELRVELLLVLSNVGWGCCSGVWLSWMPSGSLPLEVFWALGADLEDDMNEWIFEFIVNYYYLFIYGACCRDYRYIYLLWPGNALGSLRRNWRRSLGGVSGYPFRTCYLQNLTTDRWRMDRCYKCASYVYVQLQDCTWSCTVCTYVFVAHLTLKHFC